MPVPVPALEVDVPQGSNLLVIILEDNPYDIDLLKLILPAKGCALAVIPDLAHADDYLMHLLTQHANRPILMLVDQQMVSNGQPTTIDGWTLIALALQWMVAGTVAPALMVAVSADLTEERSVCARASGAFDALEKPLLEPMLDRLIHAATDGVSAALVVDQYRGAAPPHADLLGMERRTIRALGQRLYATLKALVRTTISTPPAVLITPHDVAILLEYNHRKKRSQVFRNLGGEAYVLPRFEAALNQVRTNRKRPNDKLIDYLQRNVKRDDMADILRISRTTCYRAVVQLYDDVATSYNLGRHS